MQTSKLATWQKNSPASETHHEINSLLVVVKSRLFPQFALAEVTGGRGEFAVINRGWAGTVPERDGGSQSRWARNPSEAR